MSPRPDVSEERRTQIIEAALRVFTRMGYQQARMDDIVEESGLSKGALYWYFRNKEDIVIASLNYLLENELQELYKLAQEPGSAESLLRKAIEFIIRDMENYEPFIPLVVEFLAMSQHSKKIQTLFNSNYKKFIQGLIPLIQHGIDQGEFVGANAADMAIAIGAITEGTALLKLYSPKSLDLEKHLRTNTTLLIEGLLTRANKE